MKVKINFTKNGTFFFQNFFYHFWPNSFIKMLWNYQFYWKKLSMDISMMLWQHFIHIWNTFMKEWLLKVCPSTNCNQFTRLLTTSRNSQKCHYQCLSPNCESFDVGRPCPWFEFHQEVHHVFHISQNNQWVHHMFQLVWSILCPL